MNWRRGSFRLWVIASAGWLAFTAWDVYQAITVHLIAISWWKVLAWALGPPAGIGLVILLAYWAIQGFAPAKR